MAEKLDKETILKRLKRIKNSLKTGEISWKDTPNQYQIAMAEKAKLTQLLAEEKIKHSELRIKLAKAEARKRRNGMIFRQGMVTWKLFPQLDPKILESLLIEKFGDKPYVDILQKTEEL